MLFVGVRLVMNHDDIIVDESCLECGRMIIGDRCSCSYCDHGYNTAMRINSMMLTHVMLSGCRDADAC